MAPMPSRSALLALTAALLLGGCSSGDQASFDRSRSATTATVLPPASSTTTHPVATTPSCPANPARAEPDPARPRYTLAVDVSPGEGVVQGRQQVVFTPDVDTDRLVFRLWPNGSPATPAGAAATREPGPVTVGGRPATSTRDDATTLSVRTGAGFRARQPVDIALTWRLEIAGPANDRISRNGDALRLGSFFPVLPWEPGVGWATDPPAGPFAEASTSPTADFDLTVSVPDGFGVLASGAPDPARPGHYTASAMRDVAVSVGRFDTVSAVAMAPQPVQVTVGVHRGVLESGAQYLERTVASLEDFGRRFGPYPWTTFTMAVTPDLGGGFEYPAHVMQGTGTLGIVAHEVGHQWFYALVGNDQGRDPWLDEGLATWSDARFARALDRLQSRVVPAVARNMVGQPMTFWADKGRAYQEGVYTQGAQALAALGDPDLVDCALRVYVAQHAHRIARQADLVRSLSTVFPDAAATLAAYGVKA